MKKRKNLYNQMASIRYHKRHHFHVYKLMLDELGCYFKCRCGKVKPAPAILSYFLRKFK